MSSCSSIEENKLDFKIKVPIPLKKKKTLLLDILESIASSPVNASCVPYQLWRF